MYGWLGNKAKHRAHILDAEKRPLCGLHKSTSWSGVKRTATDLGAHRLCPNCKNLKDRQQAAPKVKYFRSRSGQIRHRDTFRSVVTARADWSDISIYDMTISPWGEQVIIGSHASADEAKAAW